MVTEGQLDSEIATTDFIGIDEDFVDTFQLEIVEGRNFSGNAQTDSTSVIINEAAAQQLGISAANNSFVRIPDEPFEARVVGIVKNFHYKSLHESIGPIILGYRNNPVQSIDYFTVRLQTTDLPATLQELQIIGARFDPDHPFEYNFIDERLADFYVSEKRIGSIFGLSSMLAIVIACLGLFSLAAFTAEQRTKEIGVRKVLGASAKSIVVMMSQDFLKLVGIAFLIAAPIAFYLMKLWLSNFAYRADVGLDTVLLSGFITVTIALATVSYQSVKAAFRNPVLSLKQQ